MTAKKDNVSSELRKIEQEVDNYYKTNPLLKLPFGVAAWYLLAYYDDLNLIELTKTKNNYDISILADSLVVFLRNPLYWLWTNCAPDGNPPLTYDEHYYDACHKISVLAEEYEAFVSAFTYASQGSEDLELIGNRIQSKRIWDLRYDAYDRLVNVVSTIDDQETVELNHKTFYQITNSVKISGENFSYEFGKRAIEDVIRYLSRHFTKSFRLPDNWVFNRYSLNDFRKVAKILTALCFIHMTARNTAAKKGCVGLGYANSILIYTKEKLEWNIVRYAGVTQIVASAIIDDMTYGNRGIKVPDPAIQPLIRLNKNNYALAPFLLLSSSMERNLTVLLNKIPEERSQYLKLVDEKENHMRENLKKNFSSPNSRFYDGNLSDNSLPDIDLAIVSESEKLVMIFELKWFIEPSEQRETIEKSKEISKGISQLIKLSNAKSTKPEILYEVLKVDGTYNFIFIVVSENIIGLGSVQNPEIPVINMSHLIKKFKQVQSLIQLSKWLTRREYLPSENIHFKSVEILSKIGQWEVRWWGHQPLIATEYL